MKILFLTEFFPNSPGGLITGGSESRTYFLSGEFVKRGHNATVITAYLPNTKRTDNWGGLQIRRVGLERPYVKGTDLLRRFLYLWAVIIAGLKIDFDLVDANNTASYLAAFILSKLKNRPCVYWVPDALGWKRWTDAIGLVSGTLNAINEWLSLKMPASHIIALSKTTKDILVNDFHLPIQKITVVYPGVDICFPNNNNPAQISSLVSVQRLAKYKHVETILSALAKIHLPKNFTYTIIGDGEEKNHLMVLTDKLHLNNRVKFLGNLPHQQVLEQMAKANLFCLASDNEGFGIVTLEAMGSGTPFINSDIPVHREIRDVSQAGLIFPVGDYHNLAFQIEEILHDQNLYRKLRSNAVAFAQKHTLVTQVSETEKVYRQLL